MLSPSADPYNIPFRTLGSEVDNECDTHVSLPVSNFRTHSNASSINHRSPEKKAIIRRALDVDAVPQDILQVM